MNLILKKETLVFDNIDVISTGLESEYVIFLVDWDLEQFIIYQN